MPVAAPRMQLFIDAGAAGHERLARNPGLAFSLKRALTAPEFSA